MRCSIKTRTAIFSPFGTVSPYPFLLESRPTTIFSPAEKERKRFPGNCIFSIQVINGGVKVILAQ